MSDNLRGAAWILACGVAATCMMLAVRGASGDLHPFQIAFCRFLVGFLLVLPVVLSNGAEPLEWRRVAATVCGFVGAAVVLGFGPGGCRRLRLGGPAGGRAGPAGPLRHRPGRAGAQM